MANRFWVGGTGIWSSTNTTNWSATTGGASGASVPGSADAAIFDASSGTGTVTTNYSPTVISTTISGANINLTLGANLTCSGTFALTTSTLTLSNNTLFCSAFSSSNSNTRAISFGTGSINLTGNNQSIWQTTIANNLTYTGTPTVNCTYSGADGTRTFNHGNTSGATETNSFNVNVTAGNDTFAVFTFVKNLNFTGFSGLLNANTRTIYGNLTISSGMTLTAGAPTTTFAATSSIQQITSNGKTIDFPVAVNNLGATFEIQDNLTLGLTRTFTLTSGTIRLTGNSGNWTFSAGLFSSSNTNVRSIEFGTGNITITGSGTVWNTATPTNFSYTGTPTVNISNNSATATTISTGAMSEAQSLNFNYTTGSYTLTDTAATYRSVNFTGFTGTIPNSARTIYGNLTLVAGMTLTAGANTTTFASTTAGNSITSAGKTQDYPITFNGIGGVWTCQDALTLGATRALTMTNGTLKLKSGDTSTVGNFVANNSSVKFLQSTTPGSQATLSQASGTVNVVDLTISDINAVGGASWNAYTDFENTDAGNNDGWDFGLSPPYSIAELPITLRPFTQPRRF